MDPVTAVAAATKAIAEMVTEIVKGQPPETKKQIWDWYIEDQKRWRKFFRLDEADEPKRTLVNTDGPHGR